VQEETRRPSLLWPRYCSKECQLSAWDEHKGSCAKTLAGAEAKAAKQAAKQAEKAAEAE